MTTRCSKQPVHSFTQLRHMMSGLRRFKCHPIYQVRDALLTPRVITRSTGQALRSCLRQLTSLLSCISAFQLRPGGQDIRPRVTQCWPDDFRRRSGLHGRRRGRGNRQYSLLPDSCAFRLYFQYKKRHQNAPYGLFRPVYQ